MGIGEEAAFYLHMTDALPVWVSACSYVPLVLCVCIYIYICMCTYIYVCLLAVMRKMLSEVLYPK